MLNFRVYYRLVGTVFIAFVFCCLLQNLNAITLESKHGLLVNSISGQVWNQQGQPVSNVTVELQSELYTTLGRQQTTSSGRYNFSGIGSGSFKVRVVTIGTDYLEQIKDVQIVNVFSGASDSQFVDFQLEIDPRKASPVNDSISEVLFVQDSVSKDVKDKLSAIKKEIKDKKQGALEHLETLVKESPDYYDALIQLGTEYMKLHEYRKALAPFITAIDVNQRSFTAYYSIGYICFQINEYEKGLEAAKAATILQPTAASALLLNGTLLRLKGDLQNAEKNLLSAKKNAKAPIPQVHWQLALVYNRLNKNAEAVKELERFLDLVPNAPDKKEIKELIEKLKTAK